MAFTDRYVRADAAGGGNGTTNTNSGANGAWTLAEGITNEAAGIRLNVLVGTYANTTTTRTTAAVGTTTAPIWWRGFNATIGDCDLDDTLAKPAFTFTTGRMIWGGAHHIVSSITHLVTGATANPAVTVSGGSFWGFQLWAEHQNANAASSALAVGTAAGNVYQTCWFKATATATAVVSVAQSAEFSGCYVTGGITGISLTSGVGLVRNCIVTSPTTNCIATSSAGPHRVLNNTLYNATNGYNCTATPGAGTNVTDNLFHTLTNGVNNSTGTNTNLIHRQDNSYYTVTNPEVGFGDSPTWGTLTETSDPCASAATGDFSLVATALSRQSASPGKFENVSLTAYGDRGGVQAQAFALFIPVE